MSNAIDKSASIVLIDQNNLDKECIQLPSQYLQYAHLSAEAKRDVDEAKATLSVVEAEMAKGIRDHPEAYGIEKVTVEAVKTAVILSKRYRSAEENVRVVEHTYAMAQAVVWALEHKKRSLTLLVELHGLGYFSNVKVSKAGQEAVEEMTKRKVRSHRDDE